MASPARPSPLRFELLTVEHAALSYTSIHGNVEPWAGRDVVLAAFYTQCIIPIYRSHKLEPSLLRKVLNPDHVEDRQRARDRANAVAAMGINQATGSLPLNAGGPSLQQASTQGNRKRKAPEVERGNLVARLRKKTKAGHARSTIVIEPIPRPFAPAAALSSYAQDAVPFGDVLPGNLPEIPIHEHEAVTATGASCGAPGDMNEDGWQIAGVQTPPDQSLFPPPDSFADPPMSSQPIFGPTLGWDLPAHINPTLSPQDLVASFPSVSPPSSYQSSSTTSTVIPAMTPLTRWQDILTDLMEESSAEIGLNEVLDFGAADLFIDALFPELEALLDVFTARVVFPASHSSDGDSEWVLEASSDPFYDSPDSLGMPSDVDPWGEDAEDYASDGTMPTSSMW
ncbi:hypothetical protein EWM64_g6779 [Hericium alpestre]|uniref:Uncharacterized protein n=1 Tax=Hericium alpestre TaxID=135208 RepID=A0A4Y9ZSJ2_9AGAM|nr:hypothetical protein EWM64_g6779 [Hericium alpestre]